MAVPNMWRTKQQRYNLQGEVCPACSTAIFPPRKVCPQCNSILDANRSNHHVAASAAIFTATPDASLSPAGDD